MNAGAEKLTDLFLLCLAAFPVLILALMLLMAAALFVYWLLEPEKPAKLRPHRRPHAR